MTHALFPQYCFSINFSYWVLSIEWQFYLLFPILMFVAKRFSLKAALIVPFAVAIIARLVERYVFHMPMDTWSAANMVSLSRWSSFGAGMLSAAIVANKIKPRFITQSQTRTFWLTVALSFLAIDCEIVNRLSFVRPMIWAAAAGLWFVYLGVFEGKLKRALSLPMIAWVGRISYSWYVVHWSVLVTIGIAASAMCAGPGVVETLGPLASIPVAYLFYSIFERPFSSVNAGVVLPKEKLDALPGCAR
jgi:peptidoglycan/LPS O-acetylase OafA/YrhL